MGKTLTREQRKNSKYLRRDDERRRKESRYGQEEKEEGVLRRKPKTKWRPHSEINVE